MSNNNITLRELHEKLEESRKEFTALARDYEKAIAKLDLARKSYEKTRLFNDLIHNLIYIVIAVLIGLGYLQLDLSQVPTPK